MTLLPRPTAPASALRALFVIAASAVALLLWFPATGLASDSARTSATKTERGASPKTALISAGLLGRWAGYGTEHGSDAVRGLQARLRRLGFRSGPVDGLFGPLTERAVERFQAARGLPRDGVVGPATRTSLLARPAGRTTSRAGRPSRHRGAPGPRTTRARPPAAGAPPPRGVARDATPGAAPGPAEAPRVAVEPHASEGLPPAIVAGLGALASALVLGGAWLLAARRRAASGGGRDRSPVTRLGPGIVCAALLAVFAMGAVAGALFATRAAPGDRETVEARGAAAVPLVAGAARARAERAGIRIRPHRSPDSP